MFNTILPKIDKNADITKILVLALAFAALLGSDSILNVNFGIFRFIGGVLSYLPFVWIILVFFYGFFAVIFVRRTLWLYRCKRETICDTVLFFGVIFVIANILPYVSPFPKLSLAAYLTFTLFVIPLFCFYSGGRLGSYAIGEQSSLYYPSIILGMLFWVIGTYFLGKAAIGFVAALLVMF
ncbi:MAG: hypothetical protein HYT94_01910 [Parcubacteria group bacterium]|nr:hypothetical protein [Parcubacteria group bacterium]